MYAVIESGGKQHRVELGSEIQVDRLDVQAGDSITLDRVLLVADGEEAAIGQPIVDGAIVSAQVLGQDRGRKIIVFKYKPKARTRVKKGFRAELTTLRITDIAFGGKSAAKDAEKAAKAEARKAREAEEAEKAAAEKAAADKELAAKLAAAEPKASAEATPAVEPETQAEAQPEAAVKPKASRKKSTPTKAAETAPAEAEAAPKPEAAAEQADPEAEGTDDAASDKDE